jgi:Domain of unknown function (DUF4157)
MPFLLQEPLQTQPSHFARRGKSSLAASPHPSRLQHTIGPQAGFSILQSGTQNSDTPTATSTESYIGHDFGRTSIRPAPAGEVEAPLTIGEPGSTSEREAVHAAEQAMQMSEPRLQRAYACGDMYSHCQGQAAQPIQREGGAGETVAPSIANEVLRLPSQPLDIETRAAMETRFGRDFSHVKIHSDTRSAESARAINALAYTLGRHIVFGRGQYAPETRVGQRLIAHELTHVVQQNNSQRVLQRQEEPSPKSTHAGGKATFEILEGDLARVIDSWLEGSRQGVGQFVDGVLAKQIDQVESGSVKEFLTVMIGGTVWSAAAFATGGLAFGVSMAGMSIQASTSWPSNSKTKDNLDAVRSLLEIRIEGIHDGLNRHIGNAARKLLKDDPAVSRYRAIGQFLMSNFQPDAIDVPNNYAYLPMIDQTGVRERMLKSADQLWTNMRDVVSKSTLTGGVAILLYDEESHKYYRLGADNDAVDLYRYSSPGRRERYLDQIRPYGAAQILPELVPVAKKLAAKWPGHFFVGRRKPGTESDWLVNAGVELAYGSKS